jgi:hypothetical protein
MTRYWYIQTDIEYRKKIDDLRKEKSDLGGRNNNE